MRRGPLACAPAPHSPIPQPSGASPTHRKARDRGSREQWGVASLNPKGIFIKTRCRKGQALTRQCSEAVWWGVLQYYWFLVLRERPGPRAEDTRWGGGLRAGAPHCCLPVTDPGSPGHGISGRKPRVRPKAAPSPAPSVTGAHMLTRMGDASPPRPPGLPDMSARSVLLTAQLAEEGSRGGLGGERQV